MADDRNYGSSYLALTCAGFAAMLMPTAAQAQDAAEATTTLKGVTVTDTAIEDETKSEELASPRYTRPLLDTPQTVTVITDQVLLEQNLLTLRDALSTVPGITFGAGEGGGGYGDSINLRGYSANGDILVDGVRDSAQYTRTDPFNLEQIEVSNGANSVYSGTGSVGGTINLVSKTPHGRDATTVTAGVGTDNYYRASADVNHVVGENLAVRLNAMWHENDVPGRDVERYKRWGVAPSVTLGINEPTRLTIAYLHQEDDNTPQYGVPFYKNAVNDGALPGADREGYYGYANVDTQETAVDSITATFAHDFTETLGIRNLARYQKVTQFVLVNPPQGTYCLASGVLPTGAVCSAPQNAPNTYYPSGPRGTTRDSVNDLFYNQLDLNAEVDTGGITHSLVLGGSFSKEDYHLDSGNSLRNPLGATPNPALPTISISDPNPIYTGPVNFIRTAATEGELEAWAVYLFDTIALNEQFEINGGVRYEKSKNEVTSIAYAGNGAITGAPTTFGGDDSLFSYRVGLVYKPVPNASVYVATSNSENPSRTSVNGSCTQTVGTIVVNLCNIQPEKAKSYEAGIKWNLFDDRLQLNGAVFRNERSNYRVASNDPTFPDPVLDGKSRVDGFALGASGEVNDRWTIFANYTYLDSKVVQNISDRCRDNPAAAGCGGLVDVTAGNPLTNTPKHSGSLWTTYEIFDGFSLGYGFTYQGSFYLNNGAAPLYKSDDYWVHRAYASYEITDGATLQLNVTNLTDETYYTRIRNNGWATPGEGRAAVLTLNYAF